MFPRQLTPELTGLLQRHPAVGLLGPRQVGKTTLAFTLAADRPSLYLDLESPSDLAKLAEPELFLTRHEDNLVILDEIQRVPGIFTVLRGLIDRARREGRGNGRYLLLGSASGELLQQSAESLAGRIVYAELGPLHIGETGPEQGERLWLRGGFPSSFLAENDADSLEWRRAFVRTYLERDIPQLAPRLPAETLRRFWTMLAHEQGSLLNAAKLAAALGVSAQTITRYLDLLRDLLLVRRLQPWAANTGKRLVRSPKIYLRDSGLCHALLGIRTLDDLLAHPVAGLSWEGWAIEAILASAPAGTQAFFYRTSAGAEADLVLEFSPSRRWVFEFKRSLTPTPARGFYEACQTLNPERRLVVYPGTEDYPLPHGVEAVSLRSIIKTAQHTRV